MFDKECWLILILVILLCIVIYQFVFCMGKDKELFSSTSSNSNSTLYVFVSKTCPHCVTYNEQKHPILEKALANTNIKIKRVFADEDPDKLFEKYQVQFVPTFYCVKGDKKERVEQVDPKSLVDKFNSM